MAWQCASIDLIVCNSTILKQGEIMTNGRRKHGKHSAALPETQPAGARESVAKTGIMTNRELEEKFATKEELKQSKKFLVEKTKHEKQLHSQELRSVETNLTQKIDANEKRADDFRSDVNRQFEAIEAGNDEFRSDMNEQFKSSDARSVKRTEASESRIIEKLNDFRSDVNRQFEAIEAGNAEFRSDVNRQFEAIEAGNDEFRSDMNEQFKSSDARSVKRTGASESRIIEKLNEFKSEVFRHFAIKDKIDEESKKAKEKFDEERTKRLESTIEQQSEKNLYKTAFLVVVIGGSLSGLTYGVYQLVKFLTGG